MPLNHEHLTHHFHDRLFTPTEVLGLRKNSNHFDHLQQKRIKEAEVVGRMILSITDDDSQWRLQLPDERYDKAPDVRVMRFMDKLLVDTREIEVVTFEEHSQTEGLFRFLLRTKFKPTIAYPDQTLIVCNIELPLVNPYRVSQRMSQLIELYQLTRYDVYLSCLDQNNNPFVSQIYPELIVFDQQHKQTADSSWFH